MNKALTAASLILALSTADRLAAADDKPNAKEKCYGVAKAEKNDCASKDGKNSCAGTAKTDRDPNHWVYTPRGLCEKLAGGIKG